MPPGEKKNQKSQQTKLRPPVPLYTGHIRLDSTMCVNTSVHCTYQIGQYNVCKYFCTLDIRLDSTMYEIYL